MWNQWKLLQKCPKTLLIWWLNNIYIYACRCNKLLPSPTAAMEKYVMKKNEYNIAPKNVKIVQHNKMQLLHTIETVRARKGVKLWNFVHSSLSLSSVVFYQPDWYMIYHTMHYWSISNCKICMWVSQMITRMRKHNDNGCVFNMVDTYFCHVLMCVSTCDFGSSHFIWYIVSVPRDVWSNLKSEEKI